MVIWDRLVMLLVAALFALVQVYGSLGLAIIMLSLSVRLALLPLTLRTARRAQERQANLLALAPMIHKLKVKYRSDPRRLQAETLKLYRRHGYRPIDTRSVMNLFVQLPIGAGLYTAIKRGLGAGGRFLWIPDLAHPDAVLALLIGALTYLVSILNPGASQQTRIIGALIPAVLIAYAAWNLAAGVGLYWATSATVDILQCALLPRTPKRHPR